MSFRDEIIEAMAVAIDGERLEYAVIVAEHALDAALSYRQTVNCETCGGTGRKGDTVSPFNGATCPDCTDGRVRSESPRLEIVGGRSREGTALTPSEWRYHMLGAKGDDRTHDWLVLEREHAFFLAPDPPEGTEPRVPWMVASSQQLRAEKAVATLDAIEAMLTKKKRMGTLFDVQQIRARLAPDLPEGTPP